MKHHKNSRSLSILILLLNLTGCESGSKNTPSLVETDLTGTWLSRREIREIKQSNGDYLSSSFIEQKILLDDTENGVLYSECRHYGLEERYGIKTEERFYTNTTLAGYTLQSDGSLVQITVQEYDYAPGFTYESIDTLTRISDDIELDNGTLVLRGPISIEEYDHVCLWQITSNIGVSNDIELSVRFDNSHLSMRLDMEGEISPGTYQYGDRYSYGTDSPVYLDIRSNAQAFWETVGSNTVAARDVELTLTEFNESRILGFFEFTGQDEGSYEGEFEIVF